MTFEGETRMVTVSEGTSILEAAEKVSAPRGLAEGKHGLLPPPPPPFKKHPCTHTPAPRPHTQEWDVPFSCRNGICTTCSARVLAGAESKKVRRRREGPTEPAHTTGRCAPRNNTESHSCSPRSFPPPLFSLLGLAGGDSRPVGGPVQARVHFDLPDPSRGPGLGVVAGAIRHGVRDAIRAVREAGSCGRVGTKAAWWPARHARRSLCSFPHCLFSLPHTGHHGTKGHEHLWLV